MMRFLTTAALTVWATTAPADSVDQVTSFSLDNGMQVVVIEDHRAPVVQQMVWYRAGAADEPDGQSGVAHFLEHLMFKDTETLASGELSATVAANGGQDNAFTSYDYTAYFQRIASDRLELVMRMEADRMRNLVLSPDEIATERDVVLEERSQRTDSSPQAIFWEQMRATQYLNHAYGAPVIGWRHEIEALDRDNALSFYETFYAPNNAILVVSGDAEPDRVRELAEKYYGEFKANPDIPERARAPEPPARAERRVIYRDDRVAQPLLSLTYPAPERDPGDQSRAAALTLLAELLGGGQTSYLNEKLQFDTQTAVYVSAYYQGLTLDDTGFGISIAPAQNVTLAEAEAALHEALAQFLDDGVDADHLARIKTQVRAGQIYERDNVDGLARRYGSALAVGLSIADVQAWPDVLDAVTEDDIMQAARDLLRPEGLVTGWLTTPEDAQ